MLTRTARNAIVRDLVEAIEETQVFHIQAQEQDGHDERLTISHGGDDGHWFTVRAEFYDTSERYELPSPDVLRYELRRVPEGTLVFSTLVHEDSVFHWTPPPGGEPKGRLQWWLIKKGEEPQKVGDEFEYLYG